MMSGEEKNTNNQQQTSRLRLTEIDLLVAVMVCTTLVITLALVRPVKRTSTGVVRMVGDKELYVQDLKDTARYNIFECRKGMTVDKRNAFPYVVVGDTLKYVVPKCNTGSFALVRRVNGETLNEFTKVRHQIAESARIRNMINQKTK